MLRVVAGLREIRVCVFQHRILIAMPKLFLQSDVPRNFMILGLHRALRQILVNFPLLHQCTSYHEMRGLHLSGMSRPLKVTLFLPFFE